MKLKYIQDNSVIFMWLADSILIATVPHTCVLYSKCEQMIHPSVKTVVSISR